MGNGVSHRVVGKEEREGCKGNERGIQGRRPHVFVSVYSPSHSLSSCARLQGRLRLGAGARLDLGCPAAS